MNEEASSKYTESTSDLLISFVSNAFYYMQLWVPLFIAYKLIIKYSQNGVDSRTRLMTLFAFGKKTELSVLIEERKEKEISNESLSEDDKYEKLNKILKFLLCFAGLQVSFLLWGVMQERIIKFSYKTVDKQNFNFKNSQFLVLCNRFAGFLLSFSIILYANVRQKKLRSSLKFLTKIASISEIAPLFVCSYSSLSNVFSSWFQYEALKYVSFTTQLLAKSSKSVFVMLVGRIVSNKKYSLIEYVSVSIIAIGLFLFSDVEDTMQSSKFRKMSVTTLPGTLCLICYLLTDSFTSTWQDNLLKNHKMSSLCLMCLTNIYSCLFTLISLIEQGQLFESINFMLENDELATHVALLSLTSAIGQVFIFVTIESYGALVFTLIMTTRQVISIVLSCVLFDHVMSLRNAIGVAFIFFALFLQQFYKMKFGQRPPRQTTSKRTVI